MSLVESRKGYAALDSMRGLSPKEQKQYSDPTTDLVRDLLILDDEEATLRAATLKAVRITATGKVEVQDKPALEAANKRLDGVLKRKAALESAASEISEMGSPYRYDILEKIQVQQAGIVRAKRDLAGITAAELKLGWNSKAGRHYESPEEVLESPKYRSKKADTDRIVADREETKSELKARLDKLDSILQKTEGVA